MKIKHEVKDLFKKFEMIVKKPEMRILPGNLAFFLVMSLAPLLTLLAILASDFSIPLLNMMVDFKKVIPNDIFHLLEVYLTSASLKKGALTVYFILGLIAASNGAHSIIIASNTLYSIKESHFLRRRLKAFLLTIILIVEFLSILILLVYGNMLMKGILGFSIFDGARDHIFHFFLYLKWPIAILITYVLIKLLYAMAPDKKLPSKKVTKGALFTTTGFMLVTALYAYYANNIADYSVIYGSISNIIVLFIWVYFISYILVVGIALNVTYYEE